ncbi:hypothetical protein [Microcoleus sp. FACHB-68]|uniref:hypothetical protein n=1 Tax=Microcoleus sp. FACHB-68 TaxID=2692826 RepID=UPI0016824E91|nr:hypothetical protein [Microcoleus sp. FACHB-68]MBD1939804.1 hypothetical protein [Microcoleus sp. FACHB-68]
MTEYDLLILTIYVIVVTSVLYQSINSIGEQITIKFERASFRQQLADKDIADLVEVKFDFKERYQFEELRELVINIKNNSPEYDIDVDWESCCLIGPDGQTQRIVRLTQGLTYDLFQPQVDSVIAPGKNLKEKLTSETVLKRESEIGPFKPAAPLIKRSQLKPKSGSTNPWTSFSLRLVLRLSDPTSPEEVKPSYALYCLLSVKKLEWTYALPWYSKR